MPVNALDADALYEDARRRWQQLGQDVSAARAAGDVDAYAKLLRGLHAAEKVLVEAEQRAIRRRLEREHAEEWRMRRDQLCSARLTSSARSAKWVRDPLLRQGRAGTRGLQREVAA